MEELPIIPLLLVLLVDLRNRPRDGPGEKLERFL